MRLCLVSILFVAACLVAVLSACNDKSDKPVQPRPRQAAIPADAVKWTPAMDLFTPVLHSSDWEQPVPMPGPVNTAGAEDSPFMLLDGSAFFFTFISDVRVPPQEQLLDGVSGMWWTRKVQGLWTEPVRIILNDDVSLDGAQFVSGETMWFCSVRVGNYGEIDYYTAQLVAGEWSNWQNAGSQLNVDYDIGELHISADGATMYFGGDYAGGFGGRDIWKSEKSGSTFLSADGSELWFCGTSRLGYTGPAVFRCLKAGSDWGAPEEIISNFAGEPNLDAAGNIYFVHHFFDAGLNMKEADIYVAYRK